MDALYYVCSRVCCSAHARIPRAIPTTIKLQKALGLFLSTWGPIKSIKLIASGPHGSVKCAFAEFMTESDAYRAMYGTRKIPFFSSFLRLEPARGDRTVRFSLYESSIREIRELPFQCRDHSAMHETTSIPDTATRALLFSTDVIAEVAQQFGTVELVMASRLDYSPYIDVIYQHRCMAQHALQVCGKPDVSPCQACQELVIYGFVSVAHAPTPG